MIAPSGILWTPGSAPKQPGRYLVTLERDGQRTTDDADWDGTEWLGDWDRLADVVAYAAWPEPWQG